MIVIECRKETASRNSPSVRIALTVLMQDKGSGYRILSIPLAGRCRKILCHTGVLLGGRGWGYRVHLRPFALIALFG